MSVLPSSVVVPAGTECPVLDCGHSGSWHEHPRKLLARPRYRSWLAGRESVLPGPWCPEAVRVGPDDAGRAW